MFGVAVLLDLWYGFLFEFWVLIFWFAFLRFFRQVGLVSDTLGGFGLIMVCFGLFCGFVGWFIYGLVYLCRFGGFGLGCFCACVLLIVVL